MTRYHYDHPRPSVAVDLVLFALAEARLVVLVGRRAAAPHKGRRCLPGTYVREDENAEEACDRKIRSIGLEHTYLEQLCTFTEPKRDPRERVVSIAHYGLIPLPKDLPAGDDKIERLTWIEASPLPSSGNSPTQGTPYWAFDHAAILERAVQRLRAKIQYAPISPHFLGNEFTLSELAGVYGAILGRKLDLSNFRRDLLRQALVLPVGTRKVRGPTATTYRWNWQQQQPFFLSLG